MLDFQTFAEQRQKDLRQLKRYLDRLPLSYLDNMRLHSMVQKYPLDTLLLIATITNKESENRIRVWINEAAIASPYLNN